MLLQFFFYFSTSMFVFFTLFILFSVCRWSYGRLVNPMIGDCVATARRRAISINRTEADFNIRLFPKSIFIKGNYIQLYTKNI